MKYQGNWYKMDKLFSATVPFLCPLKTLEKAISLAAEGIEKEYWLKMN